MTSFLPRAWDRLFHRHRTFRLSSCNPAVETIPKTIRTRITTQGGVSKTLTNAREPQRLFFDVLPRPEDGPLHVDLWRPPERLSLLDMAHVKTTHGLSETLITSIRQTDPSSLLLVYHNRLGTARFLLCLSCEYRWLCGACHRPLRVDDTSFSCTGCKHAFPFPSRVPPVMERISPQKVSV